MFVLSVYWWLKTGSCWFLHQKCVTTFWKSVNKVCIWILNYHPEHKFKTELLSVGGKGKSSFKCPQRVLLSILLIFCNRTNVKNPRGSLFSEISALWDCSKFSFFVFFSKNFKRHPSHFFAFFQKYLISTKGPPFSLFDILWENEC